MIPALVTLLLTALAAGVIIWYWATPVAWWFRYLERRHGRVRPAYLMLDGARVHLLYRQGTGDSVATPVLMLHGLGADAHHWCLMAAGLPDRYPLIIPDLPGFGASELPERQPQTPADYASWLTRLLDTFKIERVHVAGNSMGGYIAAQLARDAPPRVASVCLLAPGGVASAPYSDYLQEVADHRRNRLVVTSLVEQRQALRLCMHRPVWMPEPVLRWLARRALRKSAHTQACFDAMRYAAEPLEDIVPDIRQPALLLWGARDRVLHPEGLQILKRLMPGAGALLLRNTGHLPMLEAAGPCARKYREFLHQAAE